MLLGLDGLDMTLPTVVGRCSVSSLTAIPGTWIRCKTGPLAGPPCILPHLTAGPILGASYSGQFFYHRPPLSPFQASVNFVSGSRFRCPPLSPHPRGSPRNTTNKRPAACRTKCIAGTVGLGTDVGLGWPRLRRGRIVTIMQTTPSK